MPQQPQQVSTGSRKWEPSPYSRKKATSYGGNDARFEAKDYSYELGVTLGAARGNMPIGFMQMSEEERSEALVKEFIFMLNMKRDARITKAFDEYWITRPKPKVPTVTIT